MRNSSFVESQCNFSLNSSAVCVLEVLGWKACWDLCKNTSKSQQTLKGLYSNKSQGRVEDGKRFQFTEACQTYSTDPMGTSYQIFFHVYAIRLDRHLFESLLAVLPNQMSSRINELRSLELGISETLPLGTFWSSFFKSICQSL